jgi:polar amino acid transport system substrate-binding protein
MGGCPVKVAPSYQRDSVWVRCQHRGDVVLLSEEALRFSPEIWSVAMCGVRAWMRGVMALAFLFLLAACGDRSTSPAAGTFTPHTAGELTVVTSDIPSPGFWEGTSSRLTGGFEYELARVLAQRFGLQSLRVKTESFHRIVEGQLDGADLALDLITPTRTRAQFLDFSTSYLDAAPTVVTRTGTSVPDLETARQLRWGVVRGTTFVGIVHTLIAPSRPTREYENNAAIASALEDGQIDALLFDLPLAVVTAKDSSGRLHTAAQLSEAELIAAALPKSSSNTDAVDSAIRAFASDGTIDDLLLKWVGSDAANSEKSIPLLRTAQ